MDNSKSDPTLDRLFRHMAWANQILLQKLQEVPVDALALSSENEEWTVAVIVEHLVRAAGNYGARVSQEEAPQVGVGIPSTRENLREQARRCGEFDEMLRELASHPEGMTTFQREGKTIHRARSTILGQSIHHATEHRAQIADILSLHGIRAIDLDEMDVWAYSDAEGLG
ncbi:MAG TPA: DinB family protein, partial [Candidatus Nanopelagicaceae bacterium]